MSAIDVTAKTFFERLYLVPGLRIIAPWVNCPCAPTTPTVHSLYSSNLVKKVLYFFVSNSGKICWENLPLSRNSVQHRRRGQVGWGKYALKYMCAWMFWRKLQLYLVHSCDCPVPLTLRFWKLVYNLRRSRSCDFFQDLGRVSFYRTGCRPHLD